MSKRTMVTRSMSRNENIKTVVETSTYRLYEMGFRTEVYEGKAHTWTHPFRIATAVVRKGKVLQVYPEKVEYNSFVDWVGKWPRSDYLECEGLNMQDYEKIALKKSE
jgi:hypothetical protein